MDWENVIIVILLIMKDTGKTIYQKEKVEKLIKKEHFTEVNSKQD